MTATALGQWHLTVWGAPRTKKSHNQIWMPKVRAGEKPRRIVMPSKAWQQWCKGARITHNIIGHESTLRIALPDEPQLNCRAHFYRDANRGDAVGYYQGLADLLEKRGVILNDSQIVSWDGSRLFVDKDRPRVEVTLEEIF